MKGGTFSDQRVSVFWKARLLHVKEWGKIAGVDGIMPQENWKEKQFYIRQRKTYNLNPWPVSVMLKFERQGAQEIWPHSHEPCCWFSSFPGYYVRV